ncbi:MAG: sensor histidine kinase [Blastocatellia bacterium]
MWRQKRTNIGFLLVLLVALVNALLAFDAQQRLDRAMEAAIRTHDTITGTTKLLEDLLKAETGQRGYIITGAREFLLPEQNIRKSITQSLNHLAQLLERDPESSQLMARVTPLAQRKIEELQMTIDMQESGQDEAVRAAVLSRLSQNLMEEIRVLLRQVEQQQRAIRDQQLALRRKLSRRLTLTIVMGASLTMVFIGIAFSLERREIRNAAAARAALEQANVQLEIRVAERTAQYIQANRELSRSNRELEDFAFVASHDLQEPLRKIQAFGDLLKQDYGAALGAEGLDFIQRMQNASIRMDRLIRDLLTFSRITTRIRPFQRVSLGNIAEEVVSDLETRLRQTGGRVEIRDLPDIEADPLQIRQLLQNLVGNALKFHRPGVPPVVTISGSCPPVETTEEAQHGVAATPPMWEITVTDNGIGFDEKYLDRIFTPFQRLHGKNEYEGTGMGLAICRKVAERHGGSITARSQPGAGSVFIISLPGAHLQEGQTS